MLVAGRERHREHLLSNKPHLSNMKLFKRFFEILPLAVLIAAILFSACGLLRLLLDAASPSNLAQQPGVLSELMTPSALGMSLVFQLLFPLASGLLLSAVWKTPNSLVRLLLGFVSWKIGCDFGFFLMTPSASVWEAFNPGGLAAYTIVQFTAFFVLGEWLIRDGLIRRCFAADSTDRKPPRRWSEPLRRLCSKYFYEHEDGLSPAAPWRNILCKPLIVLLSAFAAWPAYDWGAAWWNARPLPLNAAYQQFSYGLLTVFVFGGYFGRILAYNLGEQLTALLRRLAPGCSFQLLGKGFQNSAMGQFLRRRRLGKQFLFNRLCGIAMIAALLPLLAASWDVHPVSLPARMLAPTMQAGEVSAELAERQSLFPAVEKTPTDLWNLRLTLEPLLGPENLEGQTEEEILQQKKHRDLVQVRIEADDQARIYYTADGLAPRFDDYGKPANNTHLYEKPIVARTAVIVRAIAVKDGKTSPVRSIAALPNRWMVRLKEPPFDNPRGVYVTGDFRARIPFWKTDLDEKFRLETGKGHGYQVEVLTDGAEQIAYKFMIQRLDGSILWFADPSQPIRDGNNILTPAIRLRDSIQAQTDGFLEESLVKIDQYEISNRHRRVAATLLAGDAEKVSLVLPDGSQKKLSPINHQIDGIAYQTYSAWLTLPEGSVDARFSFRIEDQGQAWWAGPRAIQPAWSDVPPPPCQGRLQAVSRENDFRRHTVYFLITDRFFDGDPSNNQGKRPEGYDPKRQDLEKYFGGDIEGMRQKLEYLQELGVGAVWTTPLVENIDVMVGELSGYAGYWGMDFFEIDEHYGDWDQFDQFMKELRQRKMELMLDFVLNHSSPSFAPGDEGGRLLRSGEVQIATHGADKVETDPKRRWYHHLGGLDGVEWDRYPHSTRKDSNGLADLCLENPHVGEYMLDAAKKWVDHGVTSFRIDSLKHTDHQFARRFAIEMDQYARDKGQTEGMYMVGEWWNGGLFEPIALNFRRASANMELLDFQFADDVRNALGNVIDMQQLSRHLQLRRERFQGQESWQGTFLDNHDMSRLSAFLQTKRPRGADWLPALPKEKANRRVDMGLAILLTTPGVPIVYYGSEQYLANLKERGVEPYNREMMPPDGFHADTPAFRVIQKLSALRKISLALQRAPLEEVQVSADALVFQRRHQEETVVVAINRGEAVSWRLAGLGLADGTYRDLLSETKITVRGGRAMVDLPTDRAMVFASLESEL